MEHKWLEDFLALASAGNFRVSAKMRCVSQPAFSRRIQALEAWVGAPLIDRSSQPSCLTKAGEAFKPVAQQLLSIASLSRDEIRQKRISEKEKIRFATMSTLAQFFMPAWLKELQPFIDSDQFVVRTDFGSFNDYLEALKENVVDLFVCYEDPAVGFQGDSNLVTSAKLGEDKLIPVVAPDEKGAPLWWLPGKPHGPIPYLHTASKPALWPIKQHIETRYPDLSFNTVYESSIATALKEMAIEGYGVAWIPNAIVSGDLASGRLLRAAEQCEDIAVDIKIYRCSQNTDAKIKRFWQALL